MTLEEELKQQEQEKTSCWTKESRSKCGNAYRFLKGDGEYAIISVKTLKSLQKKGRIKISGDTLEWVDETFTF